MAYGLHDSTRDQNLDGGEWNEIECFTHRKSNPNSFAVALGLCTWVHKSEKTALGRSTPARRSPKRISSWLTAPEFWGVVRLWILCFVIGLPSNCVCNVCSGYTEMFACDSSWQLSIRLWNKINFWFVTWRIQYCGMQHKRTFTHAHAWTLTAQEI